jgi:hypothetical protein
MAHTNVSSCVLSIVASFSSGLDVFKQLREKRRQKRRSKNVNKLDEEEVSLTRSLRQGPEDIGREYQRNIQAAGDQFAVGDGQLASHDKMHNLLTTLSSYRSDFAC